MFVSQYVFVTVLNFGKDKKNLQISTWHLRVIL